MQLLIVEDDVDFATNLANLVHEQGFDAQIAHDGISALHLLKQHQFAVLIIDRMLPGIDGLTLITTLRERGDYTPILMLTALDEIHDRVSGLEAGADDYLGKPFNSSELFARLRALTRRAHPPITHYEIDDLVINQLDRTVTRNGTPINLQPREFDLLLCLAQHQGQPVSRERLLKEVWGFEFDPQTNVIDVHISRLRAKIDKNRRNPLITTRRGIGYILAGDAK